MASPDAIAYLGDTLVRLLQDGLSGLLESPKIFLSTPAEFKNFAPTEPSVTIFLYNIGVSGALRTPATQRLRHPLELHFLITPWAPVTRDAYAITGAILALLFNRPMLAGKDLLGPDGTWAPDDIVEISPESLQVVDQYYLWDPADIPYRLSLAYVVRGISIDSPLVFSEPR